MFHRFQPGLYFKLLNLKMRPKKAPLRPRRIPASRENAYFQQVLFQ